MWCTKKLDATPCFIFVCLCVNSIYRSSQYVVVGAMAMHGRSALVALNRGTLIKYLHGDDKTQKSAKKIIGKKNLEWSLFQEKFNN